MHRALGLFWGFFGGRLDFGSKGGGGAITLTLTLTLTPTLTLALTLTLTLTLSRRTLRRDRARDAAAREALDRLEASGLRALRYGAPP